MTRGIRFINGQEYMLAGRTDSKESAESQRDTLRQTWEKVRIIKIWEYDYMLYVHAAK